MPYGWLLQLRGLKARGTMTSAAFQAWTADKLVKRAIVDDNKTPEDPSDDLTYTGVALWRLVGRIDDARPASFNWKLATSAPGYNVVVTGVDGFSATYTSAEVATLKNKLVVANRVNGAPLNLGTASIKNPMTPDEVRQLEAQLAAQAGLQRPGHLRQPQAGRRRPHQHRAGGGGDHAPF